MKGEMVTVNSEVDFAAAEEIALEFNFICEEEEKVDVIAELLKEDEEDEAVEAFINETREYNPDVKCSHHEHNNGEGHTCGEHGCGSHSCH